MKKWLSLLLALALALGVAAPAMAGTDLIGYVEGNTYVNAAYGFKMELSGGWQFLSDAQLGAMLGDNSVSRREDLLRVLENKGVVCVMAAAGPSGSTSVNFVMEDLKNNAYLDEWGYYEIAQNTFGSTLSANGFYDIEMMASTVQVAGKEHVCVEVTAKAVGKVVHAGMVLMKLDQYMGVMTIYAATDAEFAEILAAIQPLSGGGGYGQTQSDPWTVIGTIFGTYWDVDFPMMETTPGVWASAPLELKAGDEFKVRQNGSWEVNFGVTNGACVQDGENVTVGWDGTYIVTLDANAPSLTLAELTEDAWSVIGGICGTEWNVDFPMVQVRPGVWQSMPLELKAGDEFKVRLNGTWALNDYGQGCVSRGANAVIAADGVYTIVLDLNAMTLTW